LTDAEISARSTRRAAWIAAGAAILAAVLALGGTWWSAQLSARSSDEAARLAAEAAVKGVTIQLSGETEKSRAEFLREQRRVLYSTIIAHEIGIRKAEKKLVDDIERTRRHNISTDSLWAQYAKLERDEPPAEIIASPPVRAQLAALTKTQNSARSHFKMMSLKGEVDEVAMDWISRYQDKRQKAFDAFCKAARKDLGSE
jgi:hypothetical protein